eukprot:scaffold629_cov140-Cylindrotheca_fusiformis.AAC.2
MRRLKNVDLQLPLASPNPIVSLINNNDYCHILSFFLWQFLLRYLLIEGQFPVHLKISLPPVELLLAILFASMSVATSSRIQWAQSNGTSAKDSK